MALCESVRGGLRWRGSAGAFRAGVGVMLLGLGLAQPVLQQAACPAAAAPLSLTQPEYQDTAEEDTIVGFMSALVQSFLHTVQPNPFPKDLILDVVENAEQGQQLDRELLNEVLIYRVGFLVCVAIGVLYIVLMPLVGFLLACCRCCGNCGGKMYQKQTSSTDCRRRTLYWSAFITTLIIFAGNVCMFRSNEAFRQSVDGGVEELDKTIENVQVFLTAVPQQVNFVVNESYKTVQEVSTNLDAIGPQLGAEIQERFRGTLEPALSSVRRLDRDTVNTDRELKKLNSSLVQLQSSADRLQANVAVVKNRINQTLSQPNCVGCASMHGELRELTLDTSISIPRLSELQLAVDEVIKSDLQANIKEAQDFFNNIPQRVTNDTKDVVENSKQRLDEIKTQIAQVTDDIPLSALTNALTNLEQAQREINNVTPEIKKAEHIRWGVCVALCCVVLLVVVCYLLGLVLGPMGLSPKKDPAKRSCTADCGGTFLMMGAGFSFLFSWLFMIVVVLLFLLGGSVYDLLCQPWDNGRLLEFIDTPGLFPGLEIGPSLGLKGDINISDIYRDCEQDQPLWTTLRLYEVVNLDELLNVSKYTDEIQMYFDNTDITLAAITLLSPDVKKQLSSFSTSAKDFDFAAVTQQINNVSGINLNTTADRLDMLADVQNNNAIQLALRSEAMDLRRIQSDIETIITPQLESINSTVNDLQPVVQNVNGTVGEVLGNVEAAQDFLNTNTTQIVETESRKFVDCQLGYFIVYADWANLTITQQVGRCGPVAGAVDSVEIVVCSHLVESLNAFWFSLGWCIIFFIPGIIFSIKLAKYYRRMKYSDVYDDHIIMNHIPRAQMKFT